MPEIRPMAYVTEPGRITFRDVVVPETGAHDVRIAVKAVSICGSDIHIFKGKHPAAPLPVPVGHEIAGEVTAVGEEVTRVRPGDRVAVEPVIACGECHFCLRGSYHLCRNISFQYRVGQGGFTPVFVANEKWVHPLPEKLSYQEGALLEPLAVAVHAVGKASPPLGATGAIFGDGAIGLLTLQVFLAAGGGDCYVAGILPYRLDKALALGAADVFNSLDQDPVAAIMEATDEIGVDCSFEAVGIETTLNQSLVALKKGGTAVVIGLFETPSVEIPANIFVQKEIALVGSQGYNWDFQRAITLIESESVDLDAIITHAFPVEELQSAFDLLMSRDDQPIKVVIEVAAGKV